MFIQIGAILAIFGPFEDFGNFLAAGRATGAEGGHPEFLAQEGGQSTPFGIFGLSGEG